MDLNIAASPIADEQFSALPSSDFTGEITPGSQKAVKVNAKRDDSFYRFDPTTLLVKQDLNVRFQTQKLKDRVRLMADDILLHGFRPDRPLTCFIDRVAGVDTVVIADGHTRLAAALLAIQDGAEIETVPVCLLPKSTSMSDVQAGQVVSNSGTPFTMLEQSIVVARLINRGFTIEETVAKIGVTQTHINNLMVLAAAPKAMQIMIANEQVSASTAIAAITTHGAEQALKLLTEQIAKAQEKGKTKVTAKMLPGAAYKRELKRSAPQLYDAVDTLVEDPAFGEVTGHVETGLAAQGGHDGLGTLPAQDLADELQGDRLDVDPVGDLTVGHDGGRVGVDEDDLVTLLTQGQAGLGSGVVELCGLTDEDRAVIGGGHLRRIQRQPGDEVGLDRRSEQGGQRCRRIGDRAARLQFADDGIGLGLQRFRQGGQLLAQHRSRRASGTGQQNQAAHLVVALRDGGQGDQRAFAVADQPGARTARLRRRLGRPGAGVVRIVGEAQAYLRRASGGAFAYAALVDADGGDAAFGQPLRQQAIGRGADADLRAVAVAIRRTGAGQDDGGRVNLALGRQ